MRLHRDPVKHSPEAANIRAVWGRRLEGWGLLFPSVGVAMLATWLALPQPIVPDHLPLPTLSPFEVEQARGRVQAQAAEVARHPLSFEVRALGERYRQLGRATFAGAALSRDEWRRFGGQLREVLAKEGAVPLLRLRAIETELFLAALTNFEGSGAISEDLKELGGDFLTAAAAHGWVRRTHAHAYIELSADERRAFFLCRWNELLQVTDLPLFQLEPVWTLLTARPRLRKPLRELAESELSLIDRVAKASTDYPGELAKGLLLVTHGKPDLAIAQFQQFLSLHPDGPYSLRARNHLTYAVQLRVKNGS